MNVIGAAILYIVGVALVIWTWRSIIDTIIVPRSISSRITFISWVVVRASFMALANRYSRYEQKDRILALLGPLALLTILLVWVVLLLVGFALLFCAADGVTFGDGLRLAGSSLFTLGVASSSRGGSTAIEFVAAATGMIVVALQIGYLPTLYGAYNRREILVTALHNRSGAPTSGPEILQSHYYIGSLTTLPPLFSAWETWAADIAESHRSYPWLLVFRSPDPRHSWVVSILAVLDAAALYLALAPSKAPPEARHCLRAGFLCLRRLAQIASSPAVGPWASRASSVIEDDPRPDDPIALSYVRFAQAFAFLRDSGFPIERSVEEAWRDFRGWRVNYETAAYLLADFVVAVPAPWSGPRSHMTREEARALMADRPRYRSPENPDGFVVPFGPRVIVPDEPGEDRHAASP